MNEITVGSHVKINNPYSPVIDGLTGTVIEITASDEYSVKLDVTKPEFQHYEDLKYGYVTQPPGNLILL